MSISIFATPAFLSKPKTEGGYLKRVSSVIRADQIAAVTHAKLNPQHGYQNDVCIYVKPDLDADRDMHFGGRSNYLDIIDELSYVDVLRKHPKVATLVLSRQDAQTLAQEKLANPIMFIPQHHCNFERQQRSRNKVTTVGVIGTKRAFVYLPPELKRSLAVRGMELVEFSEFFTRQDVVDFYQKIDVQIVWRPYRKKLANPLKIVNAASFGIPTIALDEIYFKEMGNCYIGVSNFEQFLQELDKLRSSPAIYNSFSQSGLQKAEDYHIEKISKLYQELK